MLHYIYYLHKKGRVRVKRWIFLIGLILILAACNSSPSPDNNSEENDQEQNDVENENSDDTAYDIDDEDGDVDEEEAEPSDNEDGDANQESNEVGTDDGADKKSSENKGNEKSKEEQLIDVTYDIFAAQRNLDYDYLESILSEGTTLDRDKNIFNFNNVKYPHEQELLDEVEEEHLEYRYIHEESNDSIIVGFAAIDYDTESSFTIDFQYIKENSQWKMNDMDLNK